MTTLGQAGSLTNMIERIVGDSREKLASAPEEAPLPKKRSKKGRTPEDDAKERHEEEKEKTAAEVGQALDLAEALLHVADNKGSIVDDRSEQEKVAEAARLAGYLQKTAVGGEPSHNTGNAPSDKMPPRNPPLGEGISPGASNALQNDRTRVPGGTGTQPVPKGGKAMPKPGTERARPTDSQTAMETDEDNAPGNNSGPVPKTSYPEDGVIKQAFPGVPLSYARALYKQAMKEQGETEGGERRRKGKKAPPFGKDEDQEKEASIFDYLMGKLAEDNAPTSISSGAKGLAPTVIDGGTEPGTKAGEGVPKQPKKNEGVLRKLVTQGNQKAIDVEPKDVEGPKRKRLGEILDQPMQSNKTDPTMQEALGKDVTQAAGTKLAMQSVAGRALLEKMAAGQFGEEGVQALRAAAARQRTKLAQEGGSPDVEPTSSGGGKGADDEETAKKERKEKALKKLLESAAQAKGEQKGQ